MDESNPTCNKRFKFSFARAIQHPALDIWSGHESEVNAAQEALIHRAEM